jgi:hypothetical protein
MPHFAFNVVKKKTLKNAVLVINKFDLLFKLIVKNNIEVIR